MMASGGPLVVQTTFRGLRIHALLGQGAMGWAYLGSHDALRTPVIVKIFRPAGPDLLAEAHLAARIVSPHVVGVLDAGVEGGVPFVVQRYVDGVDLHEVLEAHRSMGRPVPLGTLVRLGADLLRALSVIHMAGVVHRDIKPSNLFLSGSGEAVVGDFGVAIESGSAPLQIAGTPGFIAPEVWRGEHAGPASDLYAAGATLHMLWQGRPPFDRPDRDDLIRAHASEPYQPPPTGDPPSAYVGAVLTRLLAKRPEDRYPSAAAAERALRPMAAPLPPMTPAGPSRVIVDGVEVHLVVGDLTRIECDVLVNAANDALVMNAGVARALALAGGEAIEREAVAAGFRTLGDVVWTSAGRLRAHAVAHAIAALDGAVCIQRAVLRTLLGAEQRGARTIAFPALGTGIGQVPHALAAKLTLEAVRSFAALAPRTCRQIAIVLVDHAAHQAWSQSLAAMLDEIAPASVTPLPASTSPGATWTAS